MIRVLVADDQRLARKGWCAILALAPDMEVIGEARSGKEAVELALKLRPDVILMAVEMPELDGLEATRCIHLQDAKIAILMVDMIDEGATVQQALECGASGFVAGYDFLKELVPGVRAVHEQRHYFSPSIAAMLPDWRNGHPPRQEKA